MFAKLVSRQHGDRLYECDNVEIKRVPRRLLRDRYPDLHDEDDEQLSVLAQLEVHVHRGGPVWVLPFHGEAVYFMNDRGDTVDSTRWPDDIPYPVIPSNTSPDDLIPK